MVALTVHPRSVWLKIVAYMYNLVVQSCLSWRQSGVMIWARSNNNVFFRKESKPKGSEMVQKQLVKKSMCSHLTWTHHLSYQTTRRFPTLATLFSRRPLKESHLHASADRYRRDQLPESRSLAGWLADWLPDWCYITPLQHTIRTTPRQVIRRRCRSVSVYSTICVSPPRLCCQPTTTFPLLSHQSCSTIAFVAYVYSTVLLTSSLNGYYYLIN